MRHTNLSIFLLTRANYFFLLEGNNRSKHWQCRHDQDQLRLCIHLWKLFYVVQ
uniref:Uncharacterized protein n=1 Tax=Arundo donax TaxID=35708 RepID=A0A0A9C0K8_ARUDO